MNPVELFKEGLNCAQSVFVPVAVDMNIDKQTALKIMSPFGGGVAKTDNICGAVTGAIAAIGLHYGHTEANDADTKQRCAEATQQLITTFEKKFNSTQCTKLLNCNLSNAIEAKEAAESGVFDAKCPIYVEAAHKMAKEIINERT